VPTLGTEQGIVHYETLGRGRPVLLLHGWLGSWELWRSTIEILSADYKVYALDFFGFGESRDNNANFSVDNYVQSVDQFMERLGIVRAPLIGHSMGGTVSLAAAVRNPERIVKVAVIGSPINGTSLSWLLKASGHRGTARVFWTFPPLLKMFLRLYGFYISRDGRKVGKMIVDDVSKITVDSFFQSIGTLRETDLRSKIGVLSMPILGVYGPHDRIVNPDQAKMLKEHAPHSQIAWMKGSGHFPMMDEPGAFHDTIRAFLADG
jgi:pimeloyl-ACP methyl ester carboxylesterase